MSDQALGERTMSDQGPGAGSSAPAESEGEPQVVCPGCGRGDGLIKVSALYIAGLEAKRQRSAVQAEINTAGASLLSDISIPDRVALARRLAPPSGEKQVTRPLHPDLVVFVFSLAALVFLRGILVSQPSMLLAVLVILVVGYAAYFWKHKSLAAKFERQRAAQQARDESARRGIERWMRLYYCVHDDGIFEPGMDHVIPADQLGGYLLQA